MPCAATVPAAREATATARAALADQDMRISPHVETGIVAGEAMSGNCAHSMVNTPLQRAQRTGSGVRLRATRSAQLGHTADRKSTRLNSSHSQNSYAVFCLKKKKKTNKITKRHE